MATSKKTTKSAPSDVASISAALTAALAPTTTTLNTAPAEKGIVSKATWNGVLGFGLVNMGVKTYKSTEEEKVSLNQIHRCNADKADATPIYNKLKQGKMHCDVCDVDVEKAEILSGYEFAEGSFAVVTNDEKTACKVVADKRMNIGSFTKVESIDPIYFADAEYLVPEKGFESTFAMLRAAMVEKGVVAVAQSSQRGREQTVIIRPYGTNGMTVHYMFFDNEVRTCDKWQSVTVGDKEVEIAGMLIDALTAPFDATEHEDTYIRRYKGLINDKIMGKTPVLAIADATPAASPKVDLLAMLQASLAAPAKKSKKVAVTA